MNSFKFVDREKLGYGNCNYKFSPVCRKKKAHLYALYG
jgi:hypothetical protein